MHLENVVIDANEPQRLGRFWRAALSAETLTDEPHIFEARLAITDGPVLDFCFQRVPEVSTPSPRLHLDLSGEEDQDGVVQRLLGLGARRLDIGQGSVPWVVLADPEGNAFCVIEDGRAAYAGSGPLAALPLHSADPDRDVEFWAWLTGWRDVTGASPPRAYAIPLCGAHCWNWSPNRRPRLRPRTACTWTFVSPPLRTLTPLTPGSASAAARAWTVRSGANCRGGPTPTLPATSSAYSRRMRDLNPALEVALHSRGCRSCGLKPPSNDSSHSRESGQRVGR